MSTSQFFTLSQQLVTCD